MDIDLGAFHFLRPFSLLLLPLGIALPWLWRLGHDARRQWRGAIAPHLLPHLIVEPAGGHRLRPIHGVAALLVLGALAAAGPAWQRDRPPFLENRAPLILAVDLSPSMDAADVPPSRLEAAKHKLRDLVWRDPGTRHALLAYAGGAHMVLPPTDDARLLDSFIQALSTDLLDGAGRHAGKNAVAIIAEAQRLLLAEGSTGSLLLVSDGADTGQLDQVSKQMQGSSLQVLILAVGSVDGGVLHDAQGRPRTDANGRPLLGHFDANALKELSRAANARLGSLTLDASDLDWVTLHAQRHFDAVQEQDQRLQWKDAGYWLCWPLLLIALACLRRGWSVNWAVAILCAGALQLAPAPTRAGPVAYAFFTPDQQARWAFEHGRYAEAAARFTDPYWKGRAAYEAAEFDLALEAFARLDTPEGYFYLGNTHARLHAYPAALAAYDQALRLRPDFPQAVFNRDLVARLQAEFEDAQQGDPAEKADKLVFDDKGGKGKAGQVQVPLADSAELWLRNLTTSPADFLRRRFAMEDARAAQDGQARTDAAAPPVGRPGAGAAPRHDGEQP